MLGSIGVVVGAWVTWPIRDRRYSKADYTILKDDYEELRNMYNDKSKEYWDRDAATQATISRLEDSNSSLQKMGNAIQANLNVKTELLSIETSTRLRADARISDLQDSLRIERQRLDDAINYQREVEDGQRFRLGQIPTALGEGPGSVQTPLQTRRKPWGQVAREIEKKAAAKVPEVERNEAHWKGRIKEIEEQDKAKADKK